MFWLWKWPALTTSHINCLLLQWSAYSMHLFHMNRMVCLRSSLFPHSLYRKVTPLGQISTLSLIWQTLDSQAGCTLKFALVLYICKRETWWDPFDEGLHLQEEVLVRPTWWRFAFASGRLGQTHLMKVCPKVCFNASHLQVEELVRPIQWRFALKFALMLHICNQFNEGFLMQVEDFIRPSDEGLYSQVEDLVRPFPLRFAFANRSLVRHPSTLHSMKVCSKVCFSASHLQVGDLVRPIRRCLPGVQCCDLRTSVKLINLFFILWSVIFMFTSEIHLHRLF